MPRWRWIAILGLAPMFTGCLAFNARPPELERPLWRPSDEIPPEQKNCVYTFVFGTPDLLDAGQTCVLRDQLISLGFVKTYYGHSHHLSYFAGKMREIAANCSTAKFAIVGYDSGTISAAELAVEARKADVPVELLVFLDPARICEGCDATLARQVMTIRGDGGLFGHTPPTCGDVVIIEDAPHSAIPAHEVTVEVLERELMLIAMGTDLPRRLDLPRKPLVEPFPPPRQTVRRPKTLPAEWRFLEPYGGLGNGFQSGANLPQHQPEVLPEPRVVGPRDSEGMVK